MKTSDFHYELPPELIAQDPLADRSSSRLLVLDRQTGRYSHTVFSCIGEYLCAGDTLVLNDTKVIPARLIGIKKDTGGGAELLLLQRKAGDIWECLARPGKRLKKGASLSFGDGLLEGEIAEELPEGRRLVRFSYAGIFEEILDSLGEMPLPPYIKHKLADKSRYNTVYAAHDGSAAAPTAGLHFTEELLAHLADKGIGMARITLHVGLGTFRPVKTETVEAHQMHAEWYTIPQEAAALINRTKEEGGRVLCVGTTSCRTIEAAADEQGHVSAASGTTDIFIYPGYRFKVMDGLITNFHLPESTLLMLVSAFSGREKVLRAYRAAVKERYRFFSFGDAMLVV